MQRGASLQPNTPQREARSWVAQMCWIWGEGGERRGAAGGNLGSEPQPSHLLYLESADLRRGRGRGRCGQLIRARLVVANQFVRRAAGMGPVPPTPPPSHPTPLPLYTLLFHLLLLSSLELLMPHCAMCTTPTLLMEPGFQALCCNPPAPTTPCAHSATRTNAVLQCHLPHPLPSSGRISHRWVGATTKQLVTPSTLGEAHTLAAISDTKHTQMR